MCSFLLNPSVSRVYSVEWRILDGKILELICLKNLENHIADIISVE